MDEGLKPQGVSTTSETVQVGVLELREEVLSINKEQVQTGQVRFRREVRMRTETVTTELKRETLVIQVGPGSGEVFFNGEQLKEGETREVLLYDEQTVVNKVPYVTEEVHIGKQVVTEHHQQQVELKYEVLVTEHSEGLYNILPLEQS